MYSENFPNFNFYCIDMFPKFIVSFQVLKLFSCFLIIFHPNHLSLFLYQTFKFPLAYTVLRNDLQNLLHFCQPSKLRCGHYLAYITFANVPDKEKNSLRRRSVSSRFFEVMFTVHHDTDNTDLFWSLKSLRIFHEIRVHCLQMDSLYGRLTWPTLHQPQQVGYEEVGLKKKLLILCLKLLPWKRSCPWPLIQKAPVFLRIHETDRLVNTSRVKFQTLQVYTEISSFEALSWFLCCCSLHWSRFFVVNPCLYNFFIFC